MQKMSINEVIDKYYKKFVGLPNGQPIVRQNQPNDAFEIVVLETLYGLEKNIDVDKMNSGDIVKLSKYIVAPPDDGIDIVVELENVDENTYDFIQVKNTVLNQSEIKQALSYMEKTVSCYLKSPQSVNYNLKEVLSATSFSASDKLNCRYILVHRGTDNYFKGQKDSIEQVITGTELEVIRNCSKQAVPRVASESFGADSFNNFNLYEEAQNEPAIVLNLCGYDLAELAIKYTNTSLGRNILFGQNLREALGKSKTFDGMAKTIREEPEKFWFYNNGITILAEDYDTESQGENQDKIEKVALKNFSIINGAQTTSALGRFLKEARMDMKQEDIEKLRRVFVLVRILKVNDPEFRSRIAIYNNTQNPITTRDMASNRDEQLHLYNGLISGSAPHIYMEIRRGMTVPYDVKLYKHQITTNEELAQLAYAGFKRDPFTAKDKKTAIFDTDYKQSEFLLNEYYHKIFHFDAYNPQGILFKKDKKDIDELLFVHFLYKEAKKDLNKVYKMRIENAQVELDVCDEDDQKKKLEERIAAYEKLKAICNVCAFYCLSYYYAFKTEFPLVDAKKTYKYEKFYSDKDFHIDLIRGFRDVFLSKTISIVKELTVTFPNLNTWVRDKKSTKIFNDKVDEKIKIDMALEDQYKDFVEMYKE